jgi:uncharacterized repeat protein (TIGR01451 family)
VTPLYATKTYLALAAKAAVALGLALPSLSAHAAPCAANNPCFVTVAGGGDGSAATPTTLTEAMASVTANGNIVLAPGAYVLPAGSFATLGTLKVGSNTTITGAGKDITVITRAAAATTLANGIFLTNVDAAGANTAAAIDNVRIEALTVGLPGNTAIPTFAAALAAGFSNAGIAPQPNVNVNRFFAFNVGSNGHGSAGFSFASATTLLSGGNNQYTNFLFDAVTANWNRQGGVGRGLWSTGQRRNWVIKNGSFLDNALVGIDLNSGATRNLLIDGNRVVGNTDSGVAMHAFDEVTPVIDLVPAPAPLIDPRTSASITPVGVSIANNIITDNGRFGIEAKGANGTPQQPFNIAGNRVSATPGYVYRFALLNKNSALASIADAQFGDCRDRAAVIVARLQTAAGDGNMPVEPAINAPSGVTITGNTITNFKHPYNNIDPTTVDLDPATAGLQARTACAAPSALIAPDRDGFGLLLEGIGNTVRDNIILGNDIGLQVQGGNPNNSFSVGQGTLTTPYFDRGTGTPLGANTITHNVLCGNVDFEASRWVGGATAPYAMPGNYFGLTGALAAKLRDVNQTGFITDPYLDAFITTNATLCGPVPNLSLTKANPGAGATGGFTVNTAANYTLTISNTPVGRTTATNVVVNDTLPPNFQYNSAAPSTGATGVSCVASGTVVAGIDLVCTVTTASGIAGGGSAAFTVNVTPLPASGGVTSSNRARVSQSGATPGASTACTATGAPAGCAVVSATPATVADMSVPAVLALPAGEIGVAYPATLLTCTNTGPNTAVNARCGVTGLPLGLVADCQPAGGNPATGQSLALNATIVCSITGTPTSAGSANVTLSTNADNDNVASNNVGSGTLSVVAGTPPVLANDNAATPYFTAVTVPVLGNDNCPGTLVNNRCNPASISVVGIATGGSCALDASTPRRIIFSPSTGFTGVGSCQYRVCSSTDPAACATATLSVNVGASADVSSAVAVPISVQPGGSAIITFTFANAGPTAAQNVMPTAQLPAGLTGLVISGGGVHNPLTGVITWPAIPTLAINGTAIFTVTLTVPSIASIAISANVSTDTPEVTLSNNPSAAVLFIQLPVPVNGREGLALLLLAMLIAAACAQRQTSIKT